MDTAQIQSSREYSKFKMLLGNRGINTNNLKKVENSILKRDLTPFIPALINEHFEIIDGQHRFVNAKKNKRPFYYVMVPGVGIEEARLLNANMRTWKIEDYLQSFVEMGIRDYLILQEVVNNHGVVLSAAIKYLHGGDRRDSGITAFRNGTFTVDMARLEVFESVMKELSRLSKHMSDPNLFNSRELIATMYHVIDSPKYEKFVDKLVFHNQTIKRQPNIRSMMRHFDEIYNFKNKIYDKFV